MEPRPQSSRTLSGETLYDSDDSNENTPLLKNKTSKAFYGDGTAISKVKKTPLPILQICIVMLLQLCEPVTSQSVYPYINQVRVPMNSRLRN